MEKFFQKQYVRLRLREGSHDFNALELAKLRTSKSLHRR